MKYKNKKSLVTIRRRLKAGSIFVGGSVGSSVIFALSTMLIEKHPLLFFVVAGIAAGEWVETCLATDNILNGYSGKDCLRHSLFNNFTNIIR